MVTRLKMRKSATKQSTTRRCQIWWLPHYLMMRWISQHHESRQQESRDLYKQMELALRADAPGSPLSARHSFEYAARVKEVEERAQGRTEALTFYGQTVVRERSKKDDENPKTTPSPKDRQ